MVFGPIRKLFGTPEEKPDWGGLRTMLTKAELDALYSASKNDLSGKGTMVDLGTWLGGSTVAMLEGSARNARPAAAGQLMHAFDKFELNAYLKEHYPYPELRDIPVGGSFLPVFERQLAKWSTRLRTYPGDLGTMGWSGGPIELLHVDIMKTWALANTVVKDFFPKLIPGRSLVFHQDFVHYNTVWIHVLMYRMRDHFEVVRHIPNSTTVIFRLRSSIPEPVTAHVYGPADFSEQEVRAAFAWSRELVDHSTLHHFNIDAAEVMYQVRLGNKEQGRMLFDRFDAEEKAFLKAHPERKGRSELKNVEQALLAMS